MQELTTAIRTASAASLAEDYPLVHIPPDVAEWIDTQWALEFGEELWN